MKDVLKLLIALMFPLGALSVELNFIGNESLDKYLVRVDPQSSVKIRIDNKTHFSCWRNYHYSTLYGDEHIVVLKQQLFHPLVICENPVQVKEGISIKLENSWSHLRYYRILVPAGANLQMENLLR